jgi:hypothetical protein
MRSSLEASARQGFTSSAPTPRRPPFWAVVVVFAENARSAKKQAYYEVAGESFAGRPEWAQSKGREPVRVTASADDVVVGYITTHDGESRPASLADLDAFVDAMNHATRLRGFAAAKTRRSARSTYARSVRTSSPRSSRTTRGRRARPSATPTADPSSSRGRLSANALGHLRIETTRLGLRLALLGIGGPR